MAATPESANLSAVAEPDAGLAEGYRSPPSNIDAEQALLGAILVSNEAASRVSFLTPEHFFEPVHGRIFAAVTGLIDRGQIANPVTLKTFFENDEVLNEVGGAQYLARLAGAAVNIINTEDYGRLVYDLSIRRELIQVGEEMVNTAYDAPVELPATEQIEQAESHLFGLAEMGQHEGGFRAFSVAVTEAVSTIEAAHKRDGKLVGVTTGLKDMDGMLGGLHRTDLVVLAGRPSMGKTALATTIAFNAARAYRVEPDDQGNEVAVDGAVVGFFSLEMSADQIATRILAERTGIPSEDLRRGKVRTDQFPDVVKASQEIESLPLYIDDTPALTVSALRTRARRLKRQRGLGLVVVDYLQLLRPSGRIRHDNRVNEVTEITQALKALAKELNVPVLALSQLSRQVEHREDKRPHLADLRESGSIEQDADVVMFVFREEYYHERSEPDRSTPEHQVWLAKAEEVRGRTDIIIGKQRHGPTGNITLYFNKQLVRFSNFVAADHLPDGDL